MKKTISIMTLSLLTVTTLASASPSDQMDFSTLNQSDSHVLFGTNNNNNVITLEQNEMDETKGVHYTLNKTDAKVLFQDNDMINQQVVLLDKNQMNFSLHKIKVLSQQ